MLLTFTAFGDDSDDPDEADQKEGTRKPPGNIYSFYSQAFDTLFQKHDATKEQYRRRIHSDLSLSEFKSYFSAFCAISYLKEQYDFSEETLLDTATKAGRYWEQQRAQREDQDMRLRGKKKTPSRTIVIPKLSNPEAFVKDLIDSVCMLQKDGLRYSFVHRSFQEYFSALFIVSESTERIHRILDAYCIRFTDNVMTMLFDMHRLPIETLWVMPVISETLKLLPASGSITNRLSRFCTGIGFMFSHNLYVNANDFGSTGKDIGSMREQLVITLGPPNKVLVGRYITLGKLYSSLGNSLITRMVALEEARSRLLQNKYQGALNYETFSNFFDDIDSKSNKFFYSAHVQTISDGDGWWLTELGIGKHITGIRSELSSIIKDIEARASECGSIIDDVISI